jgi:hypothetical protein
MQIQETLEDLCYVITLTGQSRTYRLRITMANYLLDKHKRHQFRLSVDDGNGEKVLFCPDNLTNLEAVSWVTEKECLKELLEKATRGEK